MSMAEASRHIEDLLKARARALYVIVDERYRIIDLAGNAEHYGFSGVVAGGDALEAFPFLLGLSEAPSTEFAFMETPSGCSAEMYWTRLDGGHFSLLLFDVSLARDQVRDIQTIANESRILKYRLEQALEQLEQSRADLAKLAYRDPLTGLANHRYFHDVFEQEVQRSRSGGASLSLLLIDVDLFKLYNDGYGHAVGDDCLRAVAGSIDSLAHGHGHFAGRVGGEEFAMLLPSTPLADATAIAEQLCAAIRALAIPHRGSPMGIVTFSLGVADLSADPERATARLLYQAADEALYQAKHRGRDRVCVAGDSSPPA